MALRGASIGILILFLTGFGSCDGTLKEACVGRFPELEKDFEEAISALNSGSAGRNVATINAASQPKGASQPRDRAGWLEWADDHLKEAQRLLDLAESEPRVSSIRKELSFLANEIVSFHGHTQQGHSVRMAASMTQIREHARRVRLLACQ